MKQRCSFLFLIAVLASSLAAVRSADESLADLIAADGQFSTLQMLASAVGLRDMLAAEGPMTLFAPVDEAFAELPGFVLAWLQDNPAALGELLLLHVVEGAWASADLAARERVGALDISAGEAGLMVNDASVVAADMRAGNGLLHAIDRVLLPQQELEVVVPAFMEGSIVSAGSSTVFLLSAAIAARFHHEGYRGGNVTVYSIGTGAGFERFCGEGITDIANASRPIKDSERENCQAIGRDVFPLRVSMDVLVVIINSDNGFVDNLTREQLARLFSTADTWQDVNPDWPAAPIERFIPGTDSGTFEYFVEEFFDKDQAPILDAARTSLSKDNNLLLRAVANSPNAVGFLGYAFYAANRHRLNAVPLEGVVPQGSSVHDGSYPLSRPLYLYTAPEVIAQRPQVGEFLSYYLTVVNEEVAAVGYFAMNAHELNRSRLLLKAAGAS